MNLKEFASSNGVKDHFIKASFGGFAGSGKSRTATELIIGIHKDLKLTKPILFIDNEKGGRFLVPQFEKAGIEVLWKQTTKLADIIASFEYLNKGEISLLFVDSLSKVWYDYVADYKKKNGNKAFMTLQDWGKILPAWQKEFSDRFVDLNGSCVFTGRGGYTYDMEEKENENGVTKKEFVKSGVKMKMAGETPFEPDLNVWMDIDQELKDGKPVITRTALIMKDRSAIIDGKTFVNPTYKDFKPVVDYLMGLKTGEVAGTTDNTNIAPVENYSYLNERENKEIEIAKIKATFEKYGFSGTMGKDDKRILRLIFEKVFDVKTIEEVEKNFSAHIINKKVDLLEKTLSAVIECGDMADKEKYLSELVITDEMQTEAETGMNLSVNGK